MNNHCMIGPRTAIRQRVQQLLVNGLPVWDARITLERVSVNRAIPLSPKKLPAVLIYSRDEKIDKEPNADPGLRRHMLELAVEVVGGGADPQPDVTVDLLATAVELIIDRNETLNLLVPGTSGAVKASGTDSHVASDPRENGHRRRWRYGVRGLSPAVSGGLLDAHPVLPCGWPPDVSGGIQAGTGENSRYYPASWGRTGRRSPR